MGAASAPAIAAHEADSLYVAVIGGDGLMYLRDCDDAMMETIVVPLRTDLKQPLRW